MLDLSAPTVRRSQQWSLRAALLALAAVLVLASAAASTVLLYLHWRSQIDRFTRQLQYTVRTLAEALARETADGIRRVQTLPIDLPDDEAVATSQLRRRAEQLLTISPELRRIALNCADGRQLWNTGVPAGEPPVKVGPGDVTLRALETGRAQLTQLYRGRNTNAWIASYVVPVQLGGRGCVLVASIDLLQLGELLRQSLDIEGAVIGVLDGNRRFVARTVDPNKWIGEPPSAGWAASLDRSASGVVRLTTLEGRGSYSAWTPVRGTTWTVGIAVPAEPWEQPLRRTLLQQLTAVVLVASLGLSAAVILVRRLTAEADELARAARALATDRTVPQLDLRIAENEHTLRGLQDAADALSLEDARRRSAEAEREVALARAQQLGREAERANQLKDEFLAVLAHEMRTPLGAIGNAAHVLARSSPDPQTALPMLITRQVGALTRLVDDLMEAGRQLGENLRLDLQPVDLADVARQACEALRLAGALEQHAVGLLLEPAPVLGDFSRLQQAVVNLLGNAARYTPAGGSITLLTRPAAQPGWVELVVQDTGAGIAASDVQGIFSLFVRTSAARAGHSGGLGIGLSVVRQVAVLHGGSVMVESEGPGRGATFRIQIPARDMTG